MDNQLLLAPEPEMPRASGRNSSLQAKENGDLAYSRDFLENQFVYLTISPRARGLSIGVNLNPDRQCNFDCVYCDINRCQPAPEAAIDCDMAGRELERTLSLVYNGDLRRLPPYDSLPANLLRLRQVSLDGDGEPTISPKFLEAVETVVHVRAQGKFPFFKIVLITNASGLDRPDVRAGLDLLTPRDEVWAKLDVGSQRLLESTNRTTIPLRKIIENILLTARRRPVIIQSLFCQIMGAVPSLDQIHEYALRLRELREQGAQIPLVQIYSATQPPHHPNIRHLPLKTLSDIATTVRRIAGLETEVF